MKIVFISDTHNQLDIIIDDIPPCDVLVHCGDMTGRGNRFEIQDFVESIERLHARGDIQHFVGIAGNHDWGFERAPEDAISLLPDYYNYLEDSEIIIDGFKFYGSPVSPEFCSWAFNVDRGEDIRAYWDKIPSDVDVLITHGPPMGILDWSPYGSLHVGCEELAIRVKEIEPAIHAFGHIHSSNGMVLKDGITYINASNLGESYTYDYKPRILNIEREENEV